LKLGEKKKGFKVDMKTDRKKEKKELIEKSVSTEPPKKGESFLKKASENTGKKERIEGTRRLLKKKKKRRDWKTA